jgi:hypothetical protein
VTGGEVTIETGKSQFVFYPPHVCVQSTNIGLLGLSLLLLPFLDVGSWAYSTIHRLRRLFVKARAGPGLSYTGGSRERAIICLRARW